MLKRIFVRTALIGASVAAAMLSGCQSLDSLRVRDDNARSYNATLIARPDDMEYDRGRGGRGGVEFAYERYRGKGYQDIDVNHYLRLDQGRINGPQTSNNSADIHHGHIAYNHLFSLGSHFQLEPAIGVSYDRYEATAQGSVAGSRLMTIDGHKWGGIVSVTPRFMFNPYLGVELRLSESGDLHNSNITGVNPSFVVSPSPHVLFKVGYYTRDEQFETPDTQSNVRPKFSGFNGNLTLVF